jgi:hypothetical protein
MPKGSRNQRCLTSGSSKANKLTHLLPSSHTSPAPSCNLLSLYNLPHQQGVCHKTFPGLKCWHYSCAKLRPSCPEFFCTLFALQMCSVSPTKKLPFQMLKSIRCSVFLLHFPDDLLHAIFLHLFCQPFLPREYLT